MSGPPRLASSLRGVSAVSVTRDPGSRADACPSSIGVGSMDHRARDPADHYRCDSESDRREWFLRSQPDAQSDCRPDDQNQDGVESCRLHRNHRLAQIVSGGPLVLAARARRVTAGGGRPCAADPSLWKSPPQVINTREIRLRNSWQEEQDLMPQGPTCRALTMT